LSDRSRVALVGPVVAALAVAALLAWLAAEMLGPSPGHVEPLPTDTSGTDQPGPANQPPVVPPPLSVVDLEQRTLDDQPLPLGGRAGGGADTIVSLVGDSSNAMVDVEVKPPGSAFDEAGLQSTAAASTHQVRLSHHLGPGPYRWRARVREGDHASGWMLFDSTDAAHFVVAPPDASPAPAGKLSDPDSPGSASATSSGPGKGTGRPNPSEVDRLALLWSVVMPIALGLIAAAVVALAAFAWFRRRATAPPGQA
jgi:hypothetical protein